MGHWKDFLDDLAIIETKYWQHFRDKKLAELYVLNEDEKGNLRFGFKKNCDLPETIKQECMDIFKKHQSNQRMA